MKRVLLVVGPATGGMGSHVAGLAGGLPALGWTVTVFTSPQTAERFGLRTGPGVRVITEWQGLVSSVRALRRVIGEADVVQARGAELLTGASADLVERARRLGAKNPELAEVAAAAIASPAENRDR